MNAPIYYVGGSKGGVGKSKLAFALIDYLAERKHTILLLETDNANPDVFKAHQPHASESLVCKTVNLDAAEGWIELVNQCDAFPGHAAVINSAARSNMGMEKYGATLKETLQELQRDMTAFWIINRQRDSVELLHSFTSVFPDALVHVCRNLYFGEADKFELYNESKIRKGVEHKGRTLDFPELADRVADKLYSKRLPIWEALAGLPLGDTSPVEFCAMVNFIGEMPSASSVLSIKGAHFHDYGKEAKPGRKLGHATVRCSDKESMFEGFDKVLALVPTSY